MSKIRGYSQRQNHQAQTQSHNSYQNRRSTNRQKNTPQHGYQFNPNMQGHQAQHKYQPCGKSQQNNTNPQNNYYSPQNGICRGSQQHRQ